MYARIAFFEDHDPAQIDELIRRLDERSRRHEELLPESRAFLTLVDREAGKSIGITFFETLEGMPRNRRWPAFRRRTPTL
jgi:hypothetical protein